MKRLLQRPGVLVAPLAALLAALLVVVAGAPGPLAPRAEAQIPKTVKSPYAAPSEQAMLIFTRPRRRQASDTEFRVVNQAGRCISLLRNGWQTATPMWPGKQMLLILTGTAPPTVQLMEVRLSGGKTYVVELKARVNVKSPVEVQVLRRRNQPLEAFPPAVRDLVPSKPDLRGCTEWVSWKEGKIEPRASQAKRKWDEASDEHRLQHTISRGDGWTADELTAP